jgi:hypothetical protein
MRSPSPGVERRSGGDLAWQPRHAITKASSADAAGSDTAPMSTARLYTKADGPSVFAHTLCPNTWRNGKKIGDEPPATLSGAGLVRQARSGS